MRSAIGNGSESFPGGAARPATARGVLRLLQLAVASAAQEYLPRSARLLPGNGAMGLQSGRPRQPPSRRLRPSTREVGGTENVGRGTGDRPDDPGPGVADKPYRWSHQALRDVAGAGLPRGARTPL